MGRNQPRKTMFIDYRVKNASMYLLSQDSEETCWAACAVSAKAIKAKARTTEEKLLKGRYLSAWKAGNSLVLSDLRECYRSLGLVETKMDVSSRAACATQIQSRAPLIVGGAITTYQGGVAIHQGYHVRLVIGCWGNTTSADDDDFQVRVFDPFPPPNFKSEMPFLFTHFRYQMTYNGGSSPVPGVAWYVR
ncbi:MAG TPA: papain-like cysteine protease family protein [Polyangia bacterium]